MNALSIISLYSFRASDINILLYSNPSFFIQKTRNRYLLVTHISLIQSYIITIRLQGIYMKSKLQNNLPKFIKTGLAVISSLLLAAIITDKVTGGSIGVTLESNAIFTSATSLFLYYFTFNSTTEQGGNTARILSSAHSADHFLITTSFG